MRKIIHVDMDAFFVSVEIRDNPALADKPVAVGGKMHSRGVLATCNYIARQFGVRSAMPTSVALRKCPHLVLVPGRMQVYKAVSEKIRKIFERYTDLIEPLSLDEAYLDVTACTLHNGSATLIAKEICSTIHQELDLTASAGVAPIKYLAKVASDINKPNGLFVIPPNDVAQFINDMPLNKIPGIGKVTYEKLKAHNLHKGCDVTANTHKTLIEKFGKTGQLLWDRCHGIDNREIITSRERKSVGVERTFPNDIDDIELLKEILITKLLPELRKRSSGYINTRRINKIGIKVKFSDFHQTTKELSYEQFDDNLFSQLMIEAIERGQGKKLRLLGAHIGLSPIQVEKQQYAFEW